MNRPLQILYNNQTGQIFQELDGDIVSGGCHETTNEEIIQCFPEVAGGTIDKLIIPYEEIDFSKKGTYYYHIDINTKSIVWDELIPVVKE